MNRREVREKAIQALFQIDVTETERTEAIDNVVKEDEEKNSFLLELVNGTSDHIQDIDPLIEKQLRNWTMVRIGNVDRNILRMAVYEINYLDDIPRNVTLNEAVDLAKTFGNEESGRFVNGVLSNIENSKPSRGKL